VLTVQRTRDEAFGQGAIARTGGQRLPDSAAPFLPPTVLVNVNHEMDVMREETFGPVLPHHDSFKTDEEAVAGRERQLLRLTARSGPGDIARGRRLAEASIAGTVVVNEVL